MYKSFKSINLERLILGFSVFIVSSTISQARIECELGTAVGTGQCCTAIDSAAFFHSNHVWRATTGYFDSPATGNLHSSRYHCNYGISSNTTLSVRYAGVSTPELGSARCRSSAIVRQYNCNSIPLNLNLKKMTQLFDSTCRQ